MVLPDNVFFSPLHPAELVQPPRLSGVTFFVFNIFLAVSATKPLIWCNFPSCAAGSNPLVPILSSWLAWNSCWRVGDRSLTVSKATDELWALGEEGDDAMLSLVLINRRSTLQSAPRTSLVMRTSLLSRWWVMGWHCLDLGCIHVVLCLSAYLNAVFVINKSYSTHLPSWRPLLFLYATPLLILSTLAVKSSNL